MNMTLCDAISSPDMGNLPMDKSIDMFVEWCIRQRPQLRNLHCIPDNLPPSITKLTTDR